MCFKEFCQTTRKYQNILRYTNHEPSENYVCFEETCKKARNQIKVLLCGYVCFKQNHQNARNYHCPTKKTTVQLILYPFSFHKIIQRGRAYSKIVYNICFFVAFFEHAAQFVFVFAQLVLVVFSSFWAA